MRRKNKYRTELVLLVLVIGAFILSFAIGAGNERRMSLSRITQLFEDHIANQVKDYERLIEKTDLMDKLTKTEESIADLNSIVNRSYYFYLYKESQGERFLRFWNTGNVLPSDEIINGEKAEQVVKLPNGYYYSLRRVLPGHDDFTAICLVLIKSSYFVETDYFKDAYPFDPSLNDVVDISFDSGNHPVNSFNGTPLFYIKYKPGVQFVKETPLSVTLKIISFFLIVILIYLILVKRYAAVNAARQVYLFVGSLILFRVGIYLIASVSSFSEFRLFDPKIFSSGFLLPSLGDLLINSLLFSWLCVFVWNRLSVYPFREQKYSKRTLFIASITSLVILLAATFSISGVIKNIVTRSSISFDVTNVESLDIYTAIGFVILACFSLGFYYLSRTLFRFILPAFRKNSLLLYFWVTVVGLLFVSTFVGTSDITFYLPVLGWLLFYTLLFTNEHIINRFIKFSLSGTVLWIFIFSISISLLMLKEVSKAELDRRKRYIEKLSTQTDPASERLINIATRYLDSSYFRNNFHRLYDPVQNRIMRDSITEINYIGYLNSYTTNLYFFDRENNPLYNLFPLTYESLNTIVERQAKPTTLPDMYFFEAEYDKFAYITKRVIREEGTNALIGTVFIVSNPRKFGGASMSPELFKQFSESALSNSPVYQYGIYLNNILASSSASKVYPFVSFLSSQQVPKKRYEIRHRHGYTELWYRASANKAIVIARKSELLLEASTLFSYIFCTFLFLVGFINLIMIALSSLVRGRMFVSATFFPTIRSQIHGTFILINVLAFIIVGAATISFFVTRFESSNNERLSRTITIMLNELNTYDTLSTLMNNNYPDNELFSYNELNKVIKRASDIHGMDVNIYDFRGELRASSQPDVYSRGVLSTRMMPTAFYHLLRLRRVQYWQKEQVSDLSYTTIYAPVGASGSIPYAYISIPYFTSQQELKQEISSFLITLINLYAFIFLLTGLLAYLITDRIANSFTVIGNKMKKVSLSRINEEIVWNRNDEIGQLVKEYNKMVAQIKESADVLARSEREEAWREMARQVAHEIKNPLTPMKLSLQYLQKAINEDSPNIQQLTSNVARTIVEQIDHLSRIAADFSQFANINQIKPELFDLHEILAALKSIYSKNPGVSFSWKAIDGPLNIRADKTQMNRLFTNLLLNAIDACEGNLTCKINVKEATFGGKVIIEIADNGSGIEETMKTKIFTPNFTTKSSGTGLGLAMCKGIVERANGAIWFETQSGVGTTFFVELPVVTV